MAKIAYMLLCINNLRSNLERWKEVCKLRGIQDQSEEILKLDDERKSQQLIYEEFAKQLKKATPKTSEHAEISSKMEIAMKVRKATEEKLEDILLMQPNWMSDEVPVGDSNKDDVQLKQSGQCLFKSFRHENANGYDRDTAIKLSGARMIVFRGDLAKLEWALIRWLMDFHMSAGFEYVSVPSLVNSKTMTNARKLPKFASEAFKVNEYWLTSTGEIPLVCSETKINCRRKLMTFTQCFRSEAGSAGRDTQGWVRVHQFPKVELVTITSAGDAKASFNELCDRVEAVVTALELTWRKMRVCSAEIGAGAYDQIDFEVWLAGQQRWLEIASVSDCATYQSAQMNLKTTDKKLAHTLNATGGVSGRLMAALIEQNEDNRIVKLPEVLHNYIGAEFITV